MRHLSTKVISLTLITMAFLFLTGNKEVLNKTKEENIEQIKTISSQNSNFSEQIIKVKALSLEDTKSIENNQSNNKNIETVTISFAGDCTLGEYKGQGAGNQFKDYFNQNGADYFFENVRAIFESDDFTFINLEGPLTNYKQTAVKKFPIKGNPENISILSNSSVEVCSLANNHTLDCGQAGLDETKELLLFNNIGYCYEESIYRTNVNNITISFLSFNAWSANEALLDKITNAIKTERENGSDLICVMFHWGVERENYSNKTQETVAHHTIDAGADIVVGSHPHVIQGIESYNGKTIVYSLGNFSFGANKNPSDKDTFIYQQTFIVEDEKQAEYSFETIIPCRISSVTNKNNYQPIPLYEDEAIKVIERLKKYSSKYSETISSLVN